MCAVALSKGQKEVGQKESKRAKRIVNEKEGETEKVAEGSVAVQRKEVWMQKLAINQKQPGAVINSMIAVFVESTNAFGIVKSQIDCIAAKANL